MSLYLCSASGKNQGPRSNTLLLLSDVLLACPPPRARAGMPEGQEVEGWATRAACTGTARYKAADRYQRIVALPATAGGGARFQSTLRSESWLC